MTIVDDVCKFFSELKNLHFHTILLTVICAGVSFFLAERIYRTNSGSDLVIPLSFLVIVMLWDVYVFFLHMSSGTNHIDCITNQFAQLKEANERMKLEAFALHQKVSELEQINSKLKYALDKTEQKEPAVLRTFIG